MRRILFDTHARERRWVALELARACCPTCHGRNTRRQGQQQRCSDCKGYGYVFVPVGRSAALVARQIAQGAIP